MPISGPSSYVMTLDEFLQHWLNVNGALGASGPLILPSGKAIADLTALRNSLQSFAASIQGKINDVEIASGFVDLRRSALMLRLGEFNRMVRGFLGHTPYAGALPFVPSASAGQAIMLAAMDDMSSLWTTINAATIAGFTPPLLLLGGYAVAAFVADLATLKTTYQTWQIADQNLSLEREKRNDTQDAAYNILLQYRLAIPALFAPTDALVESLPRLSPEPGSTPDPVQLSGQWDATLLKAILAWTASTNPKLLRFEIRFCSGPDYSTDNESIIGSISPSDPRQFASDAGLTSPGSTSSFKVYVITTDGNERGSNTVTITRAA